MLGEKVLKLAKPSSICWGSYMSEYEEINNKLEFLTEQIKLLTQALSHIHSDVCRIMAALGVIK